jgi:hypothetical protein
MNGSSTITAAPEFIAARSALEIASRTADRPDTESPGLPFASKEGDAVVISVFFLRGSGNPAHPDTSPPGFEVQLDHAGTVVKSASLTAQEKAALRAAKVEPKVGMAETIDVQTFRVKRNRFFDISPAVWHAFAANATDAATKELISEYWSLFKDITLSYDAPFYLQSSPTFFSWVRSNAE